MFKIVKTEMNHSAQNDVKIKLKNDFNMCIDETIMKIQIWKMELNKVYNNLFHLQLLNFVSQYKYLVTIKLLIESVNFFIEVFGLR